MLFWKFIVFCREIMRNTVFRFTNVNNTAVFVLYKSGV